MNYFPVKIETKQIPYYYTKHDTSIKWCPCDFVDKLKILDKVYKGRSANNFILQNGEGTEFNMTSEDFLSMVLNAKIKDGFVEGNWNVRKRGSYYRISWNKT